MQQTPEVQSSSMIRAARRVSSCLSVKTSVTRVSGMKALLPLTLSTTSFDTQVYRPQQAEEFESPTTTINRFTFGGHDESPKKQKSPRSKNLSRRGGNFPRLPLYIRPERCDIPVYTEHGSPVPSPAYFTSQFSNSNNLSPTHSSSDEDWAAACSSLNTETSRPTDRMMQSHTTAPRCRSNVWVNMVMSKSQMDPRTTTMKWPILTPCACQIYSPKFEGWLGSAHSTDDECGSISEALPPPVSMGRASTAFDSAFELQPGSSSITGARPTMIWNSRSKIRTNVPRPTMSHPPRLQRKGTILPEYPPHGISSSNPFQHPQPNNLTLDVREKNANLHGCALSIIEELIRYFPFSTFIDYRHHIYTVRTQIHVYTSQPTSDLLSLMPLKQSPITPSPLTPSKSPPSRRMTLSLSSLTRTRTAFTARSRTPSPSPCPDKGINRTTFGKARPETGDKDKQPQPAQGRINTHLDLEPLQRIFPNATGAMIQALYAYLLAYILLEHIRPPPTTFPPHTHTHPTTPSRRANSIATTSPTRTPSKAADRLSIPFPSPSHPNDNPECNPQVTGLIQDFVLAQRIRDVRGCLERSIFCLRRGGGGDGDGVVGGDRGYGVEGEEEGPKAFLEGVLGRCLVEVVRGCEGGGRVGE
ncbi:hypothetical protein HYALB_00011550 [Hymenoscyphus albidus]|uniref:Uncharacterized protein n=1 Tax=Hymenoscyphus albidus TaxID=595503 RepID=A0A9N9LIA8_9HELO|nr:hypothetical protein HYALB_00011550 [Hymenoscyphus albidus]